MPEPDPEYRVDHDQPQTLIHFFQEDMDFQPDHQEELRRWISETAANEGFSIDEITFIFTTDNFLMGVNLQYLQHDDYTDIITFPFHEGGQTISGDIYISVERVQENAEQLGVDFFDEMHRVIIHGVLHLVGYVDGTEADKAFMRKKEDYYLARRSW